MRVLIFHIQCATMVSTPAFMVIYVFSMTGITSVDIVEVILVGYCVSNIISKFGVGLFIYVIFVAKFELSIGTGTMPVSSRKLEDRHSVSGMVTSYVPMRDADAEHVLRHCSIVPVAG